MRKHWRKLTRFLFVPGAPLHNNLVERMLKRAICHRKNSLFYKTQNGARVGDIYMSIIATKITADTRKSIKAAPTLANGRISLGK